MKYRALKTISNNSIYPGTNYANKIASVIVTRLLVNSFVQLYCAIQVSFLSSCSFIFFMGVVWYFYLYTIFSYSHFDWLQRENHILASMDNFSWIVIKFLYFSYVWSNLKRCLKKYIYIGSKIIQMEIWKENLKRKQKILSSFRYI